MAALTTDAPNSSPTTEPLYDQFFAGFVVKNLDTGESFHVDEIGSFLEKSKLLTFENASVSGWTVSIPELKEFAPRGLKPFVAYRIYITNPDPSLVDGRRTFSVFRRYSDFVKLDQAVSVPFVYVCVCVDVCGVQPWFHKCIGHQHKNIFFCHRCYKCFFNSIFCTNPSFSYGAKLPMHCHLNCQPRNGSTTGINNL